MDITADHTIRKGPITFTLGSPAGILNHDDDHSLSAATKSDLSRHNDEERPAFARAPIPLASSANWKALSIFSGCGGLDLGFLQQGIAAEAAYDIDRKALATYSANLPNVARNADLRLETPISGANILLAGAPCQGFSTAGKRDLNDPRNSLLTRVGDIALTNRTKIIVIENVPAALSGSHQVHWRALEDRLRLAGYNVRRIIIDGPACGLAQRRKRLFMLCWLGSDCINVRFKNGTHATVREALGGIDSIGDHEVEWPLEMSRDWLIARRIPQGHKLSNVRISSRSIPTWDIPEVYGPTSSYERKVLTAVAKLRRRERVRSYGDGDPVSLERLAVAMGASVIREVERLIDAGYLRRADGGQVELRQTYNGRYRRLVWDEPSPTVDTRFGRIDLFVHPERGRGMTPREAARIQGLPDAFRLAGTRKDKFIQIGNAVPPPMGAAIAEFVRDAILKA